MLEADGKWTVTRTDDNGHTFTIKANLTEGEAKELHAEMERRGHKQLYQIRPPTEQ